MQLPDRKQPRGRIGACNYIKISPYHCLRFAIREGDRPDGQASGPLDSMHSMDTMDRMAGSFGKVDGFIP